ncbi:MAG: hypothetical protein CMK41_06160, partial [Porticoccaceae bacterium]|nr:hypothetical protein [Porticoccaceae bacterium]
MYYLRLESFYSQRNNERWYGRKSVAEVNAAGSTSVARPGALTSSLTGTSGTMATSVITGDGLLAQIDSSNQATYTLGALTEDIFTEFLAK